MRNNDLSKRKLVYGVGLNDSETRTHRTEKVNGKRKIVWTCPHYRTWVSLLSRCYVALSLSRHPTYEGCTVCSEWLTFSNFKAWMQTQDWKGKQLDKDILVPGNKLYSPETCVFVSPQLNVFFTYHRLAKGKWPVGVNWQSASQRFVAQCSNPFTLKQEPLGRFSTPEEAHEAWRQRKHEHACRYADMQTDPRIAEALRTRFATATSFASTESKEVCNA